jgi:hypothetical protein
VVVTVVVIILLELVVQVVLAEAADMIKQVVQELLVQYKVLTAVLVITQYHH